jgi:NAD(P)H-dependent FMN reductase
MKPYIPILLGTYRKGRQSLKVAEWILARMEERDRLKTELIDLETYQLPIMEERYDPHMEKPPSNLQQFCDRLSQADGVLIVAPEYKGSYPGILKNALDYIPAQAWKHKPVGICTVSAGQFGGINCLAQLRLLSLALGGLPIPEPFPIAQVREMFDEQGQVRDVKLNAQLDGFINALLWYTEALVNKRQMEADR